VVCGRDSCSIPTAATSSVVWLASVDGSTGSNSLVAKGQIVGALADIAEYVAVEGRASDYEAGTLLAVSPENPAMFRKTATSHDPFLAGIVTNAAAFVAGGEVDADKERVIMSLAGRVSAKVTGENGPIAIGDLITASSKPGYGMKSTTQGRVIGMALEPFAASAPAEEGNIMVFVNPHWYFPTPSEFLQGGTSGTGVINNYTFDENATISVKEIKTLKLTVGSPESPAGITLYDRTTKLPYCLYIENGAIRAVPGNCDESINQPTVKEPTPTPTNSISLTQPSPSPFPEPLANTPEPSPTGSPAPSESPTPTESPSPEPSAEPSPELTPEPSPSESPSPEPVEGPAPSE